LGVAPGRIALTAWALLLAGGVLVAVAAQPDGYVQPVPSGGNEQQIEVLRPGGSQGLSNTDSTTEQDIGVPEPKTGAQRAASVAGKVALAVVATAVALGMAAASLLLL
jgi:hypothetical protein